MGLKNEKNLSYYAVFQAFSKKNLYIRFGLPTITKDTVKWGGYVKLVEENLDLFQTTRIFITVII